jgi:23S rRNA (uracil1939-C5)-methyltransferase
MPQVTISAMTFGPYGLGRVGGRTAMVAGAAPGDELEVAITSERRGHALARVVRVITPGPGRRHPPCPFLPRCGGCDWQHLDYPAQIRAKAEIVASRFAGALDVSLAPEGLIEPAPEEFGYRSRVRLKVDSAGRLGFYEAGTNALVAIDRCIVAALEIRLPHELARALGRNLREIEVVRNFDREVLAARLAATPRAAERARADAVMSADAAIQGIILSGGGRRVVVGDPEVTLEVEEGLVLKADADRFSQVNHAQNRRLVAAVMEMAAVEAGLELLDLFCGAGNLSLAAARRGARVTGVDADELAVSAAARNAARLSLGRANFVAMKAAEMARFLARARYRPQTVILDPPRTGAADLMEPIAKLRPRAVIYVSCDVATLLRDLRTLVHHGYRVARVRGFDFFPNTHHVELAAHLLLT